MRLVYKIRSSCVVEGPRNEARLLDRLLVAHMREYAIEHLHWEGLDVLFERHFDEDVLSCFNRRAILVDGIFERKRTL